MNNTPIATVKIVYDKFGKLESYSLTPQLTFEVDPNAIINLQETLSESKEAEVLKQNADNVLASFFAKVNEVELADREKFQVVSEVIECVRNNFNKVRVCVIKYSLEEIIQVQGQA